MIEDLNSWSIRSPKLEKCATEVTDVCITNTYLSQGIDGIENGYSAPNLHLYRSQSRRMSSLERQIQQTPTRNAFDTLVKNHLLETLFVERTFYAFFYTKKYNQKNSLREFLNKSLLRRNDLDEFDKTDHSRTGVIPYFQKAFLEAYSDEKRTKLVHKWKGIDLNPVRVPDYVRDTILEPRIGLLRNILDAWDIEYGVETKESIALREQKRNHLEMLEEGVLSQGRARTLAEQDSTWAFPELQQLSKLYEGMPDKFSRLFWACSDFSWFDWSVKEMGIRGDYTTFFRDETGTVKLEKGTLLKTLGHENMHRWQGIFSMHMPVSLRHDNLYYPIAHHVICEGSAVSGERFFVRWLKQYSEKYGISELEFDLLDLSDSDYYKNRMLRILYTCAKREWNAKDDYTRKESKLRRKGDLVIEDLVTAEKIAAKWTSLPMVADEDLLPNESIWHTYYLMNYKLGERNVERTIQLVEDFETKRLGSRQKARKSLWQNEAVLLQAIYTGAWSKTTHRDFVLKQFWPKAIKHPQFIQV
jgi:hypothetical protein